MTLTALKFTKAAASKGSKNNILVYTGGAGMFLGGFPIELRNDAAVVSKLIPLQTIHNIKMRVSEEHCNYILLDGQTVTFPYRIYFIEPGQLPSGMTFEQTMIYHAIYTRSYDGFVRERHLKAILTEAFPDWIVPYIIKLSDEYVMEIVDLLFQQLKEKNTNTIKAFCSLNTLSFLRSYDRMISYWNEFYRNRCYYYRNYVGQKLYSECFGYTRSMERDRQKDSEIFGINE